MHGIPVRGTDARELLFVGNRLCAGLRSADGVGRTGLCSNRRHATGCAAAQETGTGEAGDHPRPARRRGGRINQQSSTEGPGQSAGSGSGRGASAQAYPEDLHCLLTGESVRLCRQTTYDGVGFELFRTFCLRSGHPPRADVFRFRFIAILNEPKPLRGLVPSSWVESQQMAPS